MEIIEKITYFRFKLGLLKVKVLSGISDVNTCIKEMILLLEENITYLVESDRRIGFEQKQCLEEALKHLTVILYYLSFIQCSKSL